jgi:uncharacterized protein (TIGR03437 family)
MQNENRIIACEELARQRRLSEEPDTRLSRTLLLLRPCKLMRIIVLFSIVAAGAFGQNFDTSNNALLKGDYFIREVLITGQNVSGTINSASSAIGVATFDGAGNYKFAGTGTQGTTGTYGVAANGLLYIQSFVDSTQYAYGGVSGIGPTAFVASATEGTSGDLLVAIPAGSSVTAAALSGSYSAGYVAFPSADVTQVRQASCGFTADGAGHLSNVVVSGAALNLGGNSGIQAISGATYTLTGEGTGTLSLGASSSTQVLSGSLNFYLSADGNIFIAGTPGGYDLIVGARSLTGTASNSSWNNVFFTGALEDTVSGTTHALDAFYGSWNANGQGVSVAHDRYQSLAQPQQVYDYTFDSQSSVQSNGTVAPADIPFQVTLAAGGRVFIATGTQGLYSLLVGFAAPAYSGKGVYLNPLGVVSAANFAPITNPVAPGEIVTLFGSGLSSGTVSAPALPLPTTLGGVQVNINGQAVPLFYVSPGQLTVLVPQAITPQNGIENATFQVVNNGVTSNAVTVYTNYTAPGVFSAGGNGIGPAAAQLANYSLISTSNPATPGSAVVLYAGGLGTVSPGVADGAAAPSSPTAQVTDTDAVFVGEVQENIQFDGLTPGLAGLYQLNVSIAAGTPSGSVFADISTPDAYTSETTLAVAGSASAMSRPAVLKAKRPAKQESVRPGRVRRARPGGSERN